MEMGDEMVLDARQLHEAAMDIADSKDALDDDSSLADSVPSFQPLTAAQMNNGTSDYRRINVPQHRYTPLRNHWEEIYQPIVEHMLLQIRMNTKKRCVELRTSEFTQEPGALQKAADFVQAFIMGFEIRDAIALLRLDDLYIDSFQIKDVKILEGDHMARAIGRIAGQGGRTKFAIENATKTRIVLADTNIHILGSYRNIRIAKDALVRLIRGSQPGKVYSQMRAVANRSTERV